MKLWYFTMDLYCNSCSSIPSKPLCCTFTINAIKPLPCTIRSIFKQKKITISFSQELIIFYRKSLFTASFYITVFRLNILEKLTWSVPFISTNSSPWWIPARAAGLFSMHDKTTCDFQIFLFFFKRQTIIILKQKSTQVQYRVLAATKNFKRKNEKKTLILKGGRNQLHDELTS